ncbi:hypothetical protein A2954_01950 [Candidatus Roizmanbacteria bacterium RIFCSPLOWO2_01_FULL_37_12]|uniref:Uncharacterized protein n=1 Tax=Candidatus Roizmanbacteria bacterium RIFCSPLOWO2_01_FULL_37_12 TaxID=1802056 RepID=A0A1F7I9L7_9BACT|nr:MAG: hypothetical protein A2768_01435 [Candidatus Roizmanbacteria bacterium RIFCSPHIGHO2_01_FULL_37_16]OGK23283.1 MAG: hypothetical protein A3D76_00670 [Candidatus Roizmanbacteria bacterium RIFCSPHIGHO2_02_FULL_37_9b]OGK40055.1 MAG: hypothetical protein A2954_01950 [Candidatus Roizmanbacteria bacterium RIFCSPLOWO2_01_FULL_37_12]
MSERPEFCKVAACPMWISYCHLSESLKRGWPKLNTRRKEVKKLSELARTDKEAVISKCSDTVGRS